MVATCAHCGASGHCNRCAACRSVFFCSRTCQKAAWGVHKVQCKALAQQEYVRRTMEAARKLEIVEVLKGKYVMVTRTLNPTTGEIFQQHMQLNLAPGVQPPRMECWTCLYFEDHLLRGELFPGMPVRVEGLVKAAAYNGQEGSVLTVLGDNRVGVKLPQPSGPPKELSVKRVNLISCFRRGNCFSCSNLEVALAKLEQLNLSETVSDQDRARLQADADALRERIEVNSKAATKTFLVCWPLSQLDQLKVGTMFSKRKPGELVADIPFAGHMRFRLKLTLEYQDQRQESSSKTAKLASLTLTSLEDTHALTNKNGPVMICACAHLGRPTGSKDGALTVLCPSFAAATGETTRVLTCSWVENSIGDSRCVAILPYDEGSCPEALNAFPTRQELAGLCHDFTVVGELLPSAKTGYAENEEGGQGAGDANAEHDISVSGSLAAAHFLGGRAWKDWGDLAAAVEEDRLDRYFAVVVKLAELEGRRVRDAEGFEQAVMQGATACPHAEQLDLVEQLGLKFLTAGGGPCLIVQGQPASGPATS
jgi:hypothetical protein